MWGTKLGYGLLLVGAVFFFILFRGSLSLVMLILAILLPGILWLLLRILRRSVHISLAADCTAQNKGEPVPVNIHIRNSAGIPLPNVSLLVAYGNSLGKGEETLTVSIPVPAHNTQSILLNLSSDYCGRLTIYTKTLVLLDYLRLWKTKLHPNVQTEIVILPQTWPIGAYLSNQTALMIESDTFSKQKCGDDPSEVFAIREYRAGDAPNRIHWKLSTKTDTLMMKEFSLPVTNAVSILLSWSDYSVRLLDTMVETLFSISDALSAAELMHSISWFDEEHEALITQQINAPEDFSVAVGRLFATATASHCNRTLECIEDTAQMAHLLYLTAQTDDKTGNLLSDKRACMKTVLLMTENAQTAEIPALPQDITILPVEAGGISGSLGELVL